MKNKYLFFYIGKKCLYEKEILQKIAKTYGDFFWKVGINEFHPVLN